MFQSRESDTSSDFRLCFRSCKHALRGLCCSQGIRFQNLRHANALVNPPPRFVKPPPCVSKVIIHQRGFPVPLFGYDPHIAWESHLSPCVFPGKVSHVSPCVCHIKRSITRGRGCSGERERQFHNCGAGGDQYATATSVQGWGEGAPDTDGVYNLGIPRASHRCVLTSLRIPRASQRCELIR